MNFAWLDSKLAVCNVVLSGSLSESRVRRVLFIVLTNVFIWRYDSDTQIPCTSRELTARTFLRAY